MIEQLKKDKPNLYKTLLKLGCSIHQMEKVYKCLISGKSCKIRLGSGQFAIFDPLLGEK